MEWHCEGCLGRKLVVAEGHWICTECGLMKGPELNLSNVSYENRSQIMRPQYTRMRRFIKILRNLQGNSTVKAEVFRAIQEEIGGTPKDVSEIFAALKKLPKDLRWGLMYQNVSTIWRTLTGECSPQFTEIEMKRLQNLFNKTEILTPYFSNHKISFSFLVPALLDFCNIHRFDRFVKKIKSQEVSKRHEKTFLNIKKYLDSDENVLQRLRSDSSTLANQNPEQQNDPTVPDTTESNSENYRAGCKKRRSEIPERGEAPFRDQKDYARRLLQNFHEKGLIGMFERDF